MEGELFHLHLPRIWAVGAVGTDRTRRGRGREGHGSIPIGVTSTLPPMGLGTTIEIAGTVGPITIKGIEVDPHLVVRTEIAIFQTTEIDPRLPLLQQLITDGLPAVPLQLPLRHRHLVRH